MTVSDLDHPNSPTVCASSNTASLLASTDERLFLNIAGSLQLHYGLDISDLNNNNNNNESQNQQPADLFKRSSSLNHASNSYYKTLAQSMKTGLWINFTAMLRLL